jgi:hypothetical protein
MIGLCMIAYTAFVTPYDVAFLEPAINALFVCNRWLLPPVIDRIWVLLA